jgi:uncharacterized protein
MSDFEQVQPSVERIEAIDVVRGFALLGILGPNMLAFGWPEQAMWSPEVISMSMDMLGTGPANASANEVGHLVVEFFFFGKMMFLFTVLFGAGAVLFSRKFDGVDSTLKTGAGLWYRRMGWLLVIGLGHGLLFWYGDILVFYALAGMGLIWWVRRWSPKTLLAAGGGMYFLATVLMVQLIGFAVWDHDAGKSDLFAGIAEQIVGYQGDWASVFQQRLGDVAFMYLFVFPIYFVFAGSGMMMIGMGLMRMGLLSGERTIGFYKRLTVFGLVLGFMLTALAIWGSIKLSSDASGFLFQSVGQLVGIPTALGYAGVLILLVKTGRLRWLTHTLAAVGRMALTNYLLQTVICTTIFYGYGFGLFARVEYPQMALIMLGVWSVNIVLSLVWLRVFRFGPVEWVWRCLTYWQVLPIRVSRTPGPTG